MASIKYTTSASLELGLDKLSKISEEEQLDIVERCAPKVVDKLKEVIERKGLVESGQLVSSIQAKRSSSKVTVSAAATKRQKGFTGKRKGHGGSYAGTNQELLYFHEYGTPRMKASHPVETAATESEEPFQQAVEEEINKYLDSLGL